MTSTASDFVAIGKGIYLCRPVEPEAVDSLHPTLILLFGWMGARLPHLQKYVAEYRNRYPNTTIILVRSEADFFWSSERARRKKLLPVLEVLEAIGCIPPTTQTSSSSQISKAGLPTLQPRHRILVHSFSNGGSCQLVTLSNMIAHRKPSSPSPTATTPQYSSSAIILDSCPGGGDLRSAQRAFASAVHHPLIRILVTIVITVLFCLNALINFILRKRNILEAMKARLNDPNIFPWTHKDTPRLYVYSSGDVLVLAAFVEEHMQEARNAGLNVRTEKFGKDSMHVAHARTDPRRYWTAVAHAWKPALEGNKS